MSKRVPPTSSARTAHIDIEGDFQLTLFLEVRGDTGAARKQRDMWSGDELRLLFESPVWTGCHPFFRSRPGTEILRDSLF